MQVFGVFTQLRTRWKCVPCDGSTLFTPTQNYGHKEKERNGLLHALRIGALSNES